MITCLEIQSIPASSDGTTHTTLSLERVELGLGPKVTVDLPQSVFINRALGVVD